MDRNGPEDLPDSAMASGSDAGEPGEHLGPDDLLPEEQLLLRELERGVHPEVEVPPESPEVEAAEDDAPLPDQGGDQDDGDQDDGLSPRFSSPEQG